MKPQQQHHHHHHSAATTASSRRSQRLAAARAKAIAAAAHSHNDPQPNAVRMNGMLLLSSGAGASLCSMRWILAMMGCGVAALIALACGSHSFPILTFTSSATSGKVSTEACNASWSGGQKQQLQQWNGYSIPPLLSSFGDYPNPLGITDEDRKSFHPVVMFPKIWIEDESNEPPSSQQPTLQQNNQKKPKRKQIWNAPVMDGTNSSGAMLMATEQQREERRLQNAWQRRFKKRDNVGYGIGRYDEDRASLYTSQLFQNNDNTIDGFSGARTLHVGIDLIGPVGTKVFAFADGTIHAAGYNPDLGDYGNVVVIEHDLGVRSVNTTTTTMTTEETGRRKVWALCGHLDGSALKGKTIGKQIKKGQVVGRMGDFHENGGWLIPHVHFQLSMHPPETHDLPGAVTLNDRPRALIEYPDPRWVLGPLY